MTDFLHWTEHNGRVVASLWRDNDPRSMNSWRSYYEPITLALIPIQSGMTLTDACRKHPAPERRNT